MVSEFTIIGWRLGAKESLIVWADGESPFDAVERARREGLVPAQADWSLVAVISGSFFEAANATDLATAPRAGMGAVRSEEFSVFGFWLNGGETFHSIEKAQAGAQAMRVAVAREAGRTGGRELQIVSAIAGKHAPLVTRENCPQFW